MNFKHSMNIDCDEKKFLKFVEEKLKDNYTIKFMGNIGYMYEYKDYKLYSDNQSILDNIIKKYEKYKRFIDNLKEF